MLRNTLKGHTGLVTSFRFSPGKVRFLASCAADRTVRVYKLRGLERGTQPQFERININLDQISSLSFAVDGRHLACAKEDAHDVAFFELSGKEKPKEVMVWPTNHDGTLASCELVTR